MIYIVGAGPGDPELISCKGARLLKEASCVVWAGSLVNPQLLDYCQPTCEIYDSAKLTLEEQVDIMCTHDTPDAVVVRLHTGDPCIYGAIDEQIELLTQRNHVVEVIPCISSAFAAAAVLKQELTLPGLSQCVVLARAEGRTAVPKSQHLQALAALQATYCFYLSASQAHKLSRELIAGGLDPQTPVAALYKVTWPDERVAHATLETLPQMLEDAGMFKTTLIVVGDVLRGKRADQVKESSRLYAADFSHAYRRASTQDGFLDVKAGAEKFLLEGNAAADNTAPDNMTAGDKTCKTAEAAPKRMRPKKITFYACTQHGKDNALALINMLSTETCKDYEFTLYSKDGLIHAFSPGSINLAEETALGEVLKEAHGSKNPGASAANQTKTQGVFAWAQAHWQAAELLVLVGSTGIACRAVAPLVSSKTKDPAVIVSDENLDFIIPLLSGHIGGAQRWAELLTQQAQILNPATQVVTTTATDKRGLTAIDRWAAEQHFHIENPEEIVKVNAAHLAQSSAVNAPESAADAAAKADEPSASKLPEIGVAITDSSIEPPFKTTLMIRPRRYIAGIGCKKDADLEKLARFVTEQLLRRGLSRGALAALATHEIKAHEPALVVLAQQLDIPLLTYASAELLSLDEAQLISDKILPATGFSHSPKAQEALGVDCVCERAALCAGGSAAKLVQVKTVEPQLATFALVKMDLEAQLCCG